VSAEEKKKNKNGKGGKDDRPQINKAVIIKQLVYFVDDDLKKPEIIHPFSRRLDKGKIAVLWNRPVF
jgi:hypothetical protein